jgi:hypothetical protein
MSTAELPIYLLRNFMVILVTILCFCSQAFAHEQISLKGNSSQFHEALAQLYVQKPYLLQPQLQNESPGFNFDAVKKILDYGAIGLPLGYFCYGSFINVTEYAYTNYNFQESTFNQFLAKIFPSLLLNSPQHIGLFLQEAELLLQAYLLKLMLKLIIFCFLY